MTAATNLTGSSRRGEIVTAIGIGLLVLLMLAMVMHHPSARQTEPTAFIASIARQASADRLVHGTLAAAMTLMTSLMLGFAARLGLARPHILLGAVSSGLALVLICLAVTLDGFVVPALALRCAAIGGDCARQTQTLLGFGGLQIEYMTRLGLFALAGATALWAGELSLRKDGARIAGALGLVSAAGQIGILVLGGARLNAHSLGMIVAAQALWYLSVGAIIVLRRGPYSMQCRSDAPRLQPSPASLSEQDPPPGDLRQQGQE